MPMTDEQRQIFSLERALAHAQGYLDHVAKELLTMRETLMAEGMLATEREQCEANPMEIAQ